MIARCTVWTMAAPVSPVGKRLRLLFDESSAGRQGVPGEPSIPLGKRAWEGGTVRGLKGAAPEELAVSGHSVAGDAGKFSRGVSRLGLESGPNPVLVAPPPTTTHRVNIPPQIRPQSGAGGPSPTTPCKQSARCSGGRGG